MTKILLCLLLFLVSATSYAQTASFTYQLNGRKQNTQIERDGPEHSKNPFVKFVGEWTLKNDDWKQNWGGKDEAVKIPNHHTVSGEVNTDMSLLSIIDGPQPNGHIFWSYDPASKTFHHLSSFGTSRSGVGNGTVDQNGNLTIKVSFSDEAKGTYRIYTYKWISRDSYELMSVQYNDKDQATGLFYGGTFVRIRN